MGKKGISYFAENRNDPNFYVRMRDEDLRRQVKRIVKDMRNALIDEQDYTYFTSDKIISACITESYKQWKTAEATRKALTHYFNVVLAQQGMVQYPNVNIYEERNIVGNELAKVTNRAALWQTAYHIFNDITNCTTTAQIGAAISNLYGFDIRLFYDL